MGPRGQDFAAAQQNFFANVAKTAGREGPSGVPPASVFDPQALTQANQAFAKLWSSALEMSQTISRNMQGGREEQDPVVAELLSKMFDPRAWFSGTDGMDQALQKMAEAAARRSLGHRTQDAHAVQRVDRVAQA